MITDPELKCTYAGHKSNRINGVCANKDCRKLRPFCKNCIREFHKDHSGDLLGFGELEEYRQEALKFNRGLNSALRELGSLAKGLRELIMNSKINHDFDISRSTINQINSEVINILEVNSQSALLSTDILQLMKMVQQLQKSFKLLKQGKMEQIEILSRQPIIIQQQVQVQQKAIDKVVQTISFQFSPYEKHCSLNVKQWNVTKEQKLSTQWLDPEKLNLDSCLCVCTPTIPNEGVTIVAFQIVSRIGWIFIGVCSRDIVRAENYEPILESIFG